ncbi:uncharacterized protein LOC132706328 [Cylas formicarius]|uniref:uncharacterized protein LOC132706328 n=1 Tax=Cylas formicarius TaxID=197179 RepID=UPI002958D76F|nr:uncharacterized protein LOC132706328 [Cylas formicarius]
MATIPLAMAIVAMCFYIHLTDASPALPKPETGRCSEYEEDMNLPHDGDCKRYYRCVYGRRVPKICPDNMLFNVNMANCDMYYNVQCQHKDGEELAQDNLKVIIEDLTSGTAVGVPAVVKKVPSTTVRDKRFVYLPHPAIASAYYKIENGKKLLKHCKKGTEFDFHLEVCVKIDGKKKGR